MKQISIRAYALLSEVGAMWKKNNFPREYQDALREVLAFFQLNSEDVNTETLPAEPTKVPLHKYNEKEIMRMAQEVRMMLGVSSEHYDMTCFEQFIDFAKLAGISSMTSGVLYQHEEVRNWWINHVLVHLQASLREAIKSSDNRQIVLVNFETGQTTSIADYQFHLFYKDYINSTFCEDEEVRYRLGEKLRDFRNRLIDVQP